VRSGAVQRIAHLLYAAFLVFANLEESGFMAMKKLYHSLLLLIAGATQKELAAQVRYLKAENEILRCRCPLRVSVTSQERNRLVNLSGCAGTLIFRPNLSP
jgi:putative transposase